MSANEYAFTGLTGRLLSGTRIVSSFQQWSAQSLPEGAGTRIAVHQHQPDPVWWADLNPARLKIELDVGRTIWYSRAALISEEPLVLTIEEFDIARQD